MQRMTIALSFTGERFHPELAGDMWAEHWHRYHFVLPLIAGKKVLDVASGEGYGSALMATVATAVTGVDLSADAVSHASAAYAKLQNLVFTQGSCAKLPFDDASFDAVVSFETIEHILEQNEFLDEIKRILKPTGLLIMSSPNRAEYSDARGYTNEYHVKELYRTEFEELLGRRFECLRWYSQRNAFVSMIVPELLNAPGVATAVGGETLTLSKASPETPTTALPALYYLVLASNDTSATEHLTPRLSVFGDREEWAYNDYRKIYQASQMLWKREGELEARCAELELRILTLQNAAIAAPLPDMKQETWLARLFKRLSR